ncbi:beta subunit of N-acylethanolamine-hydrolyzing acid amidase-domain-containing protein [Biscogniauxia mediterranea]|nr:beta subunit of N-acylethanolamine-hydrolyzing acid amidase-domain-containing protein [Biscogniauxia mediterranea]
MSTPAAAKEPIPTYRIDLARPPRLRYAEVVRDFGPRMKSLASVVDVLLISVIASSWLRTIVKLLSRVCLNRVCDEEENEEIKGIAQASGVSLYLLVALNNVLDCLLGCTSGAVPVSLRQGSKRQSTAANGDDGQPRLLHFRTLDWGMDELRDLLVVLEYVNSESQSPDQVIARSITYAGFVGSLTAVRKDLSLSLNFRPNHDHSSRRLRWHQLLVLLGKRRSIGSIIRSIILRHDEPGWGLGDSPGAKDGVELKEKVNSHIERQARKMASIRSAPCYLVLCSGHEAAVVEKDFETGKIRTSTSFIAQTNHDQEDEPDRVSPATADAVSAHRRDIISCSFDIEGWIEESTDRLACIEKKWERHSKKFQPGDASTATKDGQVRSRVSRDKPKMLSTPSITEGTLQKWITAHPTTNECTHFATIMDPIAGDFRWLKRGPIEEES